ncbi:MAG: N-acetyl-gamma-glutamyl-phosphate reductase [Dissulfurimicrobium sp.]|uniref:N-acetyl-gamma-glutamyl-phosphate reductase n=1 Tax=Dissulfurimicrobium sp. TaxID=2022436 RepID=UPI00404943A8
MLRIAIVGGSGYTGVELLRLLKWHPEVNVQAVTSRRLAGKSVAEVFPSLYSLYEGLVFTEPDARCLAKDADIVFTAVPHKAAMTIVPELLDAGLKVIDLSADFRLHDQKTYEAWYEPHSAPWLLSQAVYGLAEIYRKEIRAARFVANPGCYPTSVLLPLIPLLRAGLIKPYDIVIDSKSGTSGAGRAPSAETLFCEVNEAFKAYKIGKHRHTPEIEQELSLAAGKDVVIDFTPHLVPMSRGILTTIYARPASASSTSELLETLRIFYQDEPFVRILPQGVFPNVSSVRGCNFCDIGLVLSERTNRIIIVSAIDNLVKGASGQAIQNMNIMCGIPETTGLSMAPLFP